MLLAQDDVFPRSLTSISALAKCLWRIKSAPSIRFTGSTFRLGLCGICFSAPFHEAEIRLRDAEQLGRLDLRQAEHQPPAFEPLSEGWCSWEGAGERSFMPGEALIRCTNDLWGFKQHCGSPPLRHIEFLILPGGNSPISQNGIEGFFKPRFLPGGAAWHYRLSN